MALTRKAPHYTKEKLEEIHSYGISVETREIFLHGLLAEEPYSVDHVMMNLFMKNLRFLSSITNQSDPEGIYIHQYNLGGDCDIGFGIYDLIKNCKCPITIICHGHCASMGTIILQAADKRLAMPNCHFLLHEGGASSEGTAKLTKAYAEYDDNVRNRMKNIYVHSMKDSHLFKGWTEKRIGNHLQQQFDRKQEWFLSPQEFLEYGLIDAIVNVTEYQSLCEIINV